MIASGLPTSWPSTAFGPARWALSITTLVDYLRPRYPTLTFLGGLGDQTHVTEGTMSAHNPVTKDPKTGLGIVLAVDLGVSDGNYAPLLAIRDAIYAHPNDPRMVGQGYMSGPDDKANNWPLGTGWNGGNHDAGHLHVNVGAKYFPFRPDGYLPSMDLTTPWDFMTTAPPPVPEDHDMAEYYQRNDGLIIRAEGGHVVGLDQPTWSTFVNCGAKLAGSGIDPNSFALIVKACSPGDTDQAALLAGLNAIAAQHWTVTPS